MKYIKGLDSLRFFALLVVLKEHWGPNSADTFYLDLLQKQVPDGQFGVDFFFVLSGFLITSILVIEKHRTTSKALTLKNFIIRRALRLFPLYFTTISILYLTGNHAVKDHFCYFLTYTVNFLVFKQTAWNSFGHTWSLSVEEQFYLIWPFIILFLPKKHELKAVGAFLAIGIISILYSRFSPGYFFVLPIYAFFAFAVGAILAYYNLNRLLIKNFDIIIKTTGITSIITYLILINLNISVPQIYTLLNVFIAAYFIRSVQINKVFKPFNFFINNKIFIHLGKISYGLYLFHFIIPAITLAIIVKFSLFFSEKTLHFLKNPLISYLYNLIILYVISLASYYLFEKKFLILKKFFDYKAPQYNPVLKTELIQRVETKSKT